MDPQLQFVFATLSVVLSSIAFIPYVISTWTISGRNEVRPTISGFACWMLSDAAIMAAMIASDSLSWQMIPYVVGALVVILLSMRKNYKIARIRGEFGSWTDVFSDWCRRDSFCLALVVAAIVAWAYKHDPDYAIYLTIFSNAIGTWAVARPLYDDPHRESLPAWALFLVGGIFGVGAIPAWTITGAVAPIFFVAIQALMFALTMRRFKTQYA